MKRFEEIHHTADWSFRAFGRDLRELFANAAYALFAMEGAIPVGQVRSFEVQRQVRVSGIDRETLLVNWLNELLYLQDFEHQVFFRFHIMTLSETELHARIQGIPARDLQKLIKAATFHNLQIKQIADGWEATVVVDV